jgi:hypothetical protein
MDSCSVNTRLTQTSEQKPTPENGTLFQGFEWNVPDDHKHWKRLAEQLASTRHEYY